MKGSVGYTRIKIANCENNFLCSGKTNALKRTANIGLRRFFDCTRSVSLLESRRSEEKARYSCFMAQAKGCETWSTTQFILTTKMQDPVQFVKGSCERLVNVVNCWFPLFGLAILETNLQSVHLKSLLWADQFLLSTLYHVTLIDVSRSSLKSEWHPWSH